MTRYELLDRIGVGGMAEIFRGKAVAAGGFEKPVAIKRILPHLSQDRRFVELLIAEAKVLSLLKHRNIVQIFDVGLGDDSKYFLVMEFVDGKDLGAVQRALEARRRRIPFDLALHIGAEICEALEHAHTARAPDGKPMSLVHRDVSPSNVLLSRAGEVKLTDFGIAKRAEHEGTNTGAVRGKFAYISPEQARNEHLDPRSDVFSVGVLMWELICNRRLFSNLDDMAALRGVRDGKIAMPSEIDPRLPPEIDQLLLVALAREKTRRFASAGAFGAKLRSLRYSLDVTVGDPATELAKIIESTEEVERQSGQSLPVRRPIVEHEPSEATVIRIRTADAFSARDNESSIVAARQVIDRFEEEETRLAQLSGDQIRELRRAASDRESSEGMATPPRPEPRARRPSDEATRARAPLSLGEAPTELADTPNRHVDVDEATKLVAPRDRRTPAPQRSVSSRSGRADSGSPPMATRPRGPTPGPPLSAPLPVPFVPTTLPGTPAPALAAPLSSAEPVPMMAVAPPPPPPGHGHVPALPVSGGAALPLAPPVPYGGWNAPATPQLPPRPSAMPQDRPSMPQVVGFQRGRRGGLQPWMLVVGAIIMAGLAFLITRILIH